MRSIHRLNFGRFDNWAPPAIVSSRTKEMISLSLNFVGVSRFKPVDITSHLDSGLSEVITTSVLLDWQLPFMPSVLEASCVVYEQ
jgi:hypothetical protein